MSIERSLPESQSKDTEIMALLDEPVASRSELERVLNEAESAYVSVMDFMFEVWDSSKTARQNFRAAIGCILRCMNDPTRVQPDSRRMIEGREMKSILLDICKVITGKYSCTNPQSMPDFILGCGFSGKIYERFAKGVMSEKTLREWVRDFNEYVKESSEDVFVSRAISIRNDESREEEEGDRERQNNDNDASDPAGGRQTEEVEKRSEEEEERECELDAIFDEISEQESGRIPQHLSRLNDGRLVTLKSPGEIGAELIRVYVYDVKDIVKVDKRRWWRFAKLRAQFLSSSSRIDRKQRLLRELLAETAGDLKKLPGIQREVRNFGTNDGDWNN